MTIRNIAFVSPHCVLDFTNGAATATLDALKFLASLGFQCQALCNTQIDAWEEVLVEEILARRGVRYIVRPNAQIGRYQGRMIFTSHGPVPITLFNSASTRGGWMSPEEIAAFLTTCEIFLERNRPDLVWTYGGDHVALAIQELVRRRGIPILFALHNLTYRNSDPFRLVDRVIVPTEFARRHYCDTLGLECHCLPLVVDPARVVAERTSGSFNSGTAAGGPGCPHPSPLPEGAGMHVTFVNPTPLKGVFVFARIAECLSRRRPDIPLLLVEGAARRHALGELGVPLGAVENLRTMPNSHDPRGFLGVTKLLLGSDKGSGVFVLASRTSPSNPPSSNTGQLYDSNGNRTADANLTAGDESERSSHNRLTFDGDYYSSRAVVKARSTSITSATL
jgi:hypothetical protein